MKILGSHRSDEYESQLQKHNFVNFQGTKYILKCLEIVFFGHLSVI